MPFKEDHCAIIYPGYDEFPNFYSTGVNVIAECLGGSITFRKYPTGIRLYTEACKLRKIDKCLFCTHFQGNPLFDNSALADSVKYVQEKMFAATGIPKKYLEGGAK